MLFGDLNESLVAVHVAATSRDEVIAFLLGLLDRTGKVVDPELARRDIDAHELTTSFGMQHGIAIPHAKTAGVTEMIAAVCVTDVPIDFASVDGSSSQIFVMTLSPPDQVGPHLRFLSEIGRLLKSRKMRKRMMDAGSSAELLGILLGR
jgi:mannitol/fructose-specific phosphotransferase system IIA component (Ntr-type)